MKGIMIQGCSSDAGKSYLVTALCRVFKNRGYRVTPYKSQNMSNNSYVTWDGGEMGRAQGVQAEAAGILPETWMNPILLKPRQDCCSEIILFGQVFGSQSGREYQENFIEQEGWKAVRKSLEIARKNYDLVIIEGAGSPAEINLADREIVNMSIAREAQVPVILVADVNRGGSLASVVGTLELVGEDRQRIKGIIFNQFRGSIEYFQSAVDWIENYTGIKVLGVFPYLHDVNIEGEDSLSINFLQAPSEEKPLQIGVVRLPFISNHTDLEAFAYEEDVQLSWVNPFSDLSQFKAIIIPGTKSTLADLEYLENNGLAAKLQNYSGYLFGVCGGYQIMGQDLLDPEGVDFKPGYHKTGLGLLPLSTRFVGEKKVSQTTAVGIHPLTAGLTVQGYEIHLGRSEILGTEVQPLWQIGQRLEGAATLDLKRAGTYLHNIFHNDQFRTKWLNLIRAAANYPTRPLIDTRSLREEQYDKLAAYAEKYLDIDYLVQLAESDKQG